MSKFFTQQLLRYLLTYLYLFKSRFHEKFHEWLGTHQGWVGRLLLYSGVVIIIIWGAITAGHLPHAGAPRGEPVQPAPTLTRHAGCGLPDLGKPLVVASMSMKLSSRYFQPMLPFFYEMPQNYKKNWPLFSRFHTRNA